jgi:DNA-dependent RNA polymerase auxiliary subunit epsilon
LKDKINMHASQQFSRQRGVSLTGLIFVLAVLGFLALLGAKIVPTFTEFSAIKSAIAQAKKDGAGVREMQSSFDKNADVSYITTISGKDLVFNKESGDTEISFAYEKKIGLFGPVSLVIDYAGSTAKGGVAAPAK